MYWVNEDRPLNSATVHNESRCPYPGTKIRQKNPRDGEWHGPFGTYGAAREYANNTNRKNIKDCDACTD